MAISIWKVRKEINPLGRMFQNHVSERYKVNLLKPIHGYPEAASNKLAQLWNEMNLSSARTLGSARSLACKWYQQNATLLQ